MVWVFFSDAETQPDELLHIQNVLRLNYKLWKIKCCKLRNRKVQCCISGALVFLIQENNLFSHKTRKVKSFLHVLCWFFPPLYSAVLLMKIKKLVIWPQNSLFIFASNQILFQSGFFHSCEPFWHAFRFMTSCCVRMFQLWFLDSFLQFFGFFLQYAKLYHELLGQVMHLLV